MPNKKTTLSAAVKNRQMIERVEGLYKKAHRASLGSYKFYKTTMYLKWYLSNLHYHLLDARTDRPVKTDVAYALLTKCIEELEKIRGDLA